MVSQTLRIMSVLSIGLSVMLFAGTSFAQQDNGGFDQPPGFEDGGGLDQFNDVPTDTGNDQLGGTGGTGGTGGNQGGGGPQFGDDFFDNLDNDIPEFENLRQSPFVGRRGGENLGGSINEEISPLGFIGRTRNALGVDSAIQPRTPLNIRTEPQNTTGFTVERKGIRARRIMNFVSPVISDVAVANRFQTRFRRQPTSASISQTFRVQIKDRTATVDGTVRSQEEASRIIAQLRLEPGVYKINNQLTVQDSLSRN